ncbi:TPA: hypothetical protein HA351_04970 [Methanosarcinaceae archaeon]|nr:hypothetical protein [Methanosarcinaceae archaeon]
MSAEQKARRRKLDPKWVDPEGMTYEESQAAMDKMWPRMAEPDEEGIDLHPEDPQRRFIATSEGVIFSPAAPLTEGDKAEGEAMWEKMTGGNYSPAKTEEKTEAKKAGKRGI